MNVNLENHMVVGEQYEDKEIPYFDEQDQDEKDRKHCIRLSALIRARNERSIRHENLLEATGGYK